MARNPSPSAISAGEAMLRTIHEAVNFRQQAAELRDDDLWVREFISGTTDRHWSEAGIRLLTVVSARADAYSEMADSIEAEVVQRINLLTVMCGVRVPPWLE